MLQSQAKKKGIFIMPEENVVSAENNQTESTENKDFIIEKNVLKKYLGTDSHVLVPDNVTAIGDRAFKNQKKIITVTLPENITSIGHYAFSGCISLTSIEIPETVTIIGDYAFNGCKRLPVIDIPESVRKIGRGAFGFTMLMIH